MERDDGYTFDCRIPPFSLESKTEDPGSTTEVMWEVEWLVPCNYGNKIQMLF